MKISKKQFEALTHEQKAHYFCICEPSYQKYWPKPDGIAKYSGALGNQLVRFTEEKGGFATPEEAIEDARLFQQAIREDLRKGKYDEVPV